ncbi:TPA: hypothetical protein L6A81_12025 [Pseudomonas aeruginosa]|nr:hypothetical protein [Pseudomonas aeruginosa]
MAAHEHWTRYLVVPAGGALPQTQIIEAANAQIAGLMANVENALMQRQRLAHSINLSSVETTQEELAKALVGREMVEGALRAANILQHEARFLITSTSAVTEGLVDTISEKTDELIRLINELSTTCDCLQVVAAAPRR